jgi:hypothetical protein
VHNLRSHPNVVKLYGYCLEPPTVCLILELLPLSLKDVLYPPVESTEPSAGVASSSSAAAQLGASSGPDASSATSATPAAGVTLSSSLAAAEGFTKFGSVASDTMLQADLPADATAVVTQQGDLSQHYATAISNPAAGTTSLGPVQLPGTHPQLAGHDSGTPSQAWQGSSTFNGAYDEAVESPEGMEVKVQDPKGGQPEQPPAEAGNRPCTDLKQQQPQQQQAPRPSLLRLLQIATDVAAGLEHLHSRPLLAKVHSLMLAAVNEADDGRGSTAALAPLVTVDEDQAEAAPTVRSLPSAATACVTPSDSVLQAVLGGGGDSGDLAEQAEPVSSGGGGGSGAPGPRIVHRGGWVVKCVQSIVWFTMLKAMPASRSMNRILVGTTKMCGCVECLTGPCLNLVLLSPAA